LSLKIPAFEHVTKWSNQISCKKNGGALIVDLSQGVENLRLMSELNWFVAHTKSRREKKFAEYCERQMIAATLPCYDSAHKYRGKTVVFRKPLFPGYVFLKIAPEQVLGVRQSGHLANLLTVFDQETFSNQLADIVRALEVDMDVQLAPGIGEGMRVRIKGGPLAGLEGWVEKRYGMSRVLLRLDFINQAAAVKVEADQLEEA
jgi:transcription antitermination factor NusG